jgi:hypothetical protein
LRTDSDLLPDRAGKALVRMGDADVVRQIEAFYPTAGRIGQLYSPEVLGNVKVPESESALFRLLRAREEAEARGDTEGGEGDEVEEGDALTYLAAGLIYLCPTDPEVLEALRRLIVEGRYDGGMYDLDNMMLPVCEMVGYDPPEARKWRKKREEAEKRRRRLPDAEALIGLLGPMFKWDGVSEEDPEEDEELPRDEDGYYRPPTSPRRWVDAAPPPPDPPRVDLAVPIRRSSPKVGRNDPCPCGSGKKYKKCCMAKDEAAGGVG